MNFNFSFLHLKKIFFVSAVISAGCVGLFSEPLRYVGSDFLKGIPEKKLNAIIENALGEKPESTLRGSPSGEKDLRSGNADFALLILPSGGENLPEIKDGTWRIFPLAYQVAYVVVASANPAEEIKFSQLASIFGKHAKEPAASWQDAGVSGFSPTLNPCVGGRSKTNAVTFFQKKVLPKFELKATVRSIISDTDVFKEIMNAPGSIAIVGTPIPAGIPVKALSVSNDKQDTNTAAYAPAFSNIYNNDYPLTIPLYIVYPTKNRNILKPVLSYLYSQEMADLLVGAGFLPLDGNFRVQFQKGIDNIK